MAFPQQKKTGQRAPALRKYGRSAQLFPQLQVEQLEERLVLANWSGDITADTTWSSGEVQHVVGNVHVAQGATLTVEPGTVIQFNGGTSLTVDGTLKAQGTSGQPIFFTSVRDNSPLGGSNTAGSRDWGCIQLNASSTGSILDHATIRYAGGANDAAVSVNGAPLTLTNSTISDAYADGLRLLGSHAVVTGATFRNNGLPFGGAGIHIDPTSQPTVSGNTFVNNHINGVAVDGGSLSAGSTTWNNPDVVYHLYAPLTVPQGSTLAIGAGQVVKVDFRNSTDNLIVNGTLDAQGTAAQPVIFTSYRDDTAGGDTNNNGASSGITGDWRNLLFTSTSTNNVLNHVEVRYAGSGSVAAVIADRAPLTLSGGAISDAYADGLRLLGSNAIITGVSFRNNGLLFGGAAIKADLSSTPIISDVQLSNNQTNGLQLEGGTLPGDTTWNNPAIVYVVRNEITIPAGVTLTIAPGQSVKASRFGGNVLLVAGTLDAQGTSAEPILFTSIADDTTGGDTDNSGSNTLPGAADWSGLEFTSTSTGNVLDHVEVRYAFAAGADQQAAIEVNGGTLTLRNSVIRDGVHDGLIAGPDAVVTVTSSIFTRVRRALLALAGSQLTAVNNTIDNNAIGVEADGTTATLTNNLITYSGSAGIRQTAPALLTLGFNDVFNPGASNYLGLADQTGTNGNLSQDPLYVDRSNRDYRLRVGSPAIDSASSSGAPATDFVGNTRFDDSGVVDSGSGPVTFFDRGALERRDLSGSNLDLEVVAVTAPTSGTVNDSIAVSWTVVNRGTDTIVGSWTDAVYLSLGDGDLDAADVFLGEVRHQGDLGAGQQYTQSTSFRLPGAVPGDYRVLVLTDARNEVFEAAQEVNNVSGATTQLTLTLASVPQLLPGVPQSGVFQNPGETFVYRIAAPANQKLVVTLTGTQPAAQHSLLLGLGRIPTIASYAAASSPLQQGPNQSVEITQTQGGDYYVVVRAAALVAASDPFSIRADFPVFSLAAVTPATAGNAGLVTLTLQGAELLDVTGAQLRGPGGLVLSATALRVADAGTVLATFDLTGRPVGAYDVLALRDDGTSVTRSAALNVHQGGQADAWFRLDGPAQARQGRLLTYTLSFGNRGDVDAPAQLLEVAFPDGVSFALTPNGVQQFGSYALFGVSDRSAGASLPPGTTVDVPLYVKVPVGQPSLEVTARSVPVDDPSLTAQVIDWAAIRVAARPAEFPVDQWNPFFDQLMAQLGATNGTLIERLAADAVQLVAPGQPGVSVVQAFAEEVNRALIAAGQGAVDVPAALTARAGLQAQSTAADDSSNSAGGRTWVVIVGASDYRTNTSYNDLPSTPKDAEDVRDYFQNDLNVPRDQILVTIDRIGQEGDTITPATIQHGITWLQRNAGPNDTVVFYYSGHGSSANPNLELTDGSNIEVGSSADPVLQMRRVDASHRVVILDSCRAGGFAPSASGDGKTILLAASRADEDSINNSLSNSIFTSNLLKALRTRQPDGSRPSLATAFEAARVATEKDTAAIRLGSLGYHNKQHPVKGGNLPDVTFRDRAAEAANKIVLEALGGFLYQFFQIAKSLLLSAFDPNDKSAPAGAGPGRFLPAEQTLTYTVRFENQASATLPAAQVVVTDVLDSNLDWSTFRVLGVGFSNRDFLAPPDAPFFSTRVPLDDSGLGVALNVNLNPADGRLTATFDTVNFVTGQTPLDDLAGFLPPNDGTGLGEGYLRFTVRPRPGLPTGVRIENTASIVFDANPAIITNTEFNTLDRGTPTSAVTALPARATEADFTVNWSGSDDAGGSGIASYDVFVSTDGGPFLPFLVGTTQTSATFNGAPSHRYAFYSVATDHVGLWQARPSQAQAFTETPPAAGDDAYGVTASKTLRVSAPGVLGNDRAGDGPLTLTLLSTPTQGKLTLYADGSFVYKPRLTARGPDQFTYQITDSAGRQSAVATVALLPLVSFRSAGQRQSESTTTVKIPVKLSIPSRQAVTVRYDVTAGTASNGTDYQLSGGVLTIPAGKSGRKIVFTVSNDRLHEANETIQVTLSDPGNTLLGTQTVFTYTIVNDDQAATLRSHPAPTPGAAAFVELFLPTAGNYPEPERTEDRKNTAANEAREDTSPTVLSCEADPFLGLVAGLLQEQSADESFSGLSVLDEVFALYPLQCITRNEPTHLHRPLSCAER